MPTPIPYVIDSCWIALYTYAIAHPSELDGSDTLCDSPSGSPDYVCSFSLFDAQCSTTAAWPNYHCYYTGAGDLFYCDPNISGFPFYDCTSKVSGLILDCLSTGPTAYNCVTGLARIECRGSNSIFLPDVNFACQLIDATYATCDYWTPPIFITATDGQTTSAIIAKVG